MITSSYPVSSVVVEDAGSIRTGLEQGRIVKLSVLLDDNPRNDRVRPLNLPPQGPGYAGQIVIDRSYAAAELPPYTAADDYEFPV